MIRLVADENFNGYIVRGLQEHHPEIDIVRVQDVGLSSTPDPAILEWAAREGRILLTHDVTTMTDFGYERVARGETMPGIVVMPEDVSIGRAIEDIRVLVACSSEGEWEGQVLFLPW